MLYLPRLCIITLISLSYLVSLIKISIDETIHMHTLFDEGFISTIFFNDNIPSDSIKVSTKPFVSNSLKKCNSYVNLFSYSLCVVQDIHYTTML